MIHTLWGNADSGAIHTFRLTVREIGLMQCDPGEAISAMRDAMFKQGAISFELAKDAITGDFVMTVEGPATLALPMKEAA